MAMLFCTVNYGILPFEGRMRWNDWCLGDSFFNAFNQEECLYININFFMVMVAK